MLTGKGLILETIPRSTQIIVDICRDIGCSWVCFVLQGFDFWTETDPETGEEFTTTNQVLNDQYVDDIRTASDFQIDVLVANATLEEAAYLNVYRSHFQKAHEEDLQESLYVNGQCILVFDVQKDDVLLMNYTVKAVGFQPADCLFGMVLYFTPKQANEVYQMIKAYECI